MTSGSSNMIETMLINVIYEANVPEGQRDETLYLMNTPNIVFPGEAPKFKLSSNAVIAGIGAEEFTDVQPVPVTQFGDFMTHFYGAPPAPGAPPVPVPPHPGAALGPFVRLTGRGSQIMVTTQLSGCSIVIRPLGEDFEVAHLQRSPWGIPYNGPQMANELKDRVTARAGILDGAFIYGALGPGVIPVPLNPGYDFINTTANVIAVRITGEGWNFYSQIRNGFIDDNVRELWRIYPDNPPVILYPTP